MSQRRGTVLLSGGKKGQGYIRTLEVNDELQDWALKYVTHLSKYRGKYHHSEITGVSIARVHIMASDVINHRILDTSTLGAMEV